MDSLEKYPPDNIYIYFMNILTLVSRNVWYAIIANVQKTQYNFEVRHLEAFRVIMICRDPILMQVSYL